MVTPASAPGCAPVAGAGLRLGLGSGCDIPPGEIVVRFPELFDGGAVGVT